MGPDRRYPSKQVIHLSSIHISDCTLLVLHPFNGLFSRTTWVSWYQKGKPVWIWMRLEMIQILYYSSEYCRHEPGQLMDCL